MPQTTALRLIAQQTRTASPDAGQLGAIVAALRAAAAELSRWVGPEGASALLTRATHRAEQRHPIVSRVRVAAESPPTLVVEESVAGDDADRLAAGLEVALVELFELLTRLVGADLTMKLAEQMTGGETPDTAPDKGEEPQT